MPGRLKTLIVIPTFNERESLPGLARQALNLSEDFCLLVVDDNSPDGTGAAAEKSAQEFPGRMWVLHRPGKQGLGSAYINGFLWGLARPERFGYFIQMDADGSHEPSSIPDLLKAAESADLAIGSRYIGGVRVLDWPMRRLLLSYLSNVLVRVATGLPLSDCTSGFKCFPRRTMERIPWEKIHAMSYDFQIEVNFFCRSIGLRLQEVPITFLNRNQGASKLSRADIIRAAGALRRLALQRIIAPFNRSWRDGGTASREDAG